MRFDVLTLFPEAFASFCTTSLIGKAIDAGTIEVHLHNIRDYSTDKHRKVDDAPYGGGAGMVMMCQPLYDSITAVKNMVDDHAPVIFLSPGGTVFSQEIATDMAQNDSRIILLCGHYEGIDQRIIDLLVDREISIGEYVLTGGELPAQVMIDAVARLVPGVIGNETSHMVESFSPQLDGKIEYPHYTRPEIFQGLPVPDVLLSGHHARIDAWRTQQCRERKIPLGKKAGETPHAISKTLRQDRSTK